jgi:endosialidase-like protein
MKSRNIGLSTVVAALFLATAVPAQEATNQGANVAPSAAAKSPSEAIVPRLMKFSGTLLDEQAQPMKSPVGVTFALYAQQSGSAALWMETQNVETDAKGNYTVLLGANSASGIPADLFNTGEARWLGVQAERQLEQPRILLVSVPYALKAGDAQTLGGLPPSAFAPANSVASNSASSSSAPPMTLLAPSLATAAPSVATVGGSGLTNFIPLWTPNGSTLGNSILFQSTTSNVNVNGSFSLPAVSTATATTGSNSHPLDFFASSFNSTPAPGAAVAQHFRWQSEPVNNNTANPSGKLNLLFASGTGTPTETGLSINNKGVITFAPGQTFADPGDVKSVGLSAPATDFTVSGSPVTSSGTLNFAWNVVPTNLNTANAIVKRDASGNFSAGAGTFSGNLSSVGIVSGAAGSFAGNLAAGGSVSGLGGIFSGNVGIGGTLQLVNSTATAGNILKGGTLFLHNFGSRNAFLGENAGNLTMTGDNNTGTGVNALRANTTGCCNTASGNNALWQNTTGGGNTASGDGALYSNSTGNSNTALGRWALISNTTGSDNTAIGVTALQSNNDGNRNTATGNHALQSNCPAVPVGVCDVAFAEGVENTATGFDALLGNISGSYNTAIGVNALESNTSGETNTAVGHHALLSNTIGSENTAIGVAADVSSGSLNNATAIGGGAIVDASNKIRLGNTAVTVIEGNVAYTFTSDKNRKENFQPLNAEATLTKLASLPVSSWNYIGQDGKQFRHYGPVAQDFFGAFGHDGVGTVGTDITINSGDMDGILIVAVQALEKRTAELTQEKERLTETVEALKAELEAQRQDLAAVAGRLKRLDRQELAALGPAGRRPTPGSTASIVTMP